MLTFLNLKSKAIKIFLSPIFDLEKLLKFADDNFIVRWAKTMEEVKTRMELSLAAIINWMKDLCSKCCMNFKIKILNLSIKCMYFWTQFHHIVLHYATLKFDNQFNQYYSLDCAILKIYSMLKWHHMFQFNCAPFR